MKTFTTVPQFEHAVYTYNPTRCIYEYSSADELKPPFNKLTENLVITNAIASKIGKNAGTIIQSTARKNGHFSFLTGVHYTSHDGWFVGNDFKNIDGVKCRYTILFNRLDIKKELHIYYFIMPDDLGMYDRIDFADFAIPRIVK